MAVWEWGGADPKCGEYTNPIARWMANCPDVGITPIVVTPAAPRSIAELTSGLWTPDEAVRQTWAKYAAEKERLRAAAGADWQTGSPPPGTSPLGPADLLTIAGAVVLGLVAIKVILK